MLSIRSRTGHSMLVLSLGVFGLGCGLAASALAQEPTPPEQATVTHGVAPGSAWVNVDRVTMTKSGHLRVPIRCAPGSVPCEGTLKLTSQTPIAPGRGK